MVKYFIELVCVVPGRIRPIDSTIFYLEVVSNIAIHCIKTNNSRPTYTEALRPVGDLFIFNAAA